MKRAFGSLQQTPSYGTWSCLVETAALRCDAPLYHTLLLCLADRGRASITFDHTPCSAIRAEHQRLVRFFDRVLYDYLWIVKYVRNAVLHREGAPAIERRLCRSDQYIFIVEWYRNGRLHRLDGPAVVDDCLGVEKWYKDGELHRVGGPAVRKWREERWVERGKLHRTDGPAVTRRGDWYWYYQGKLHRADGPACMEDGEMQWRWMDKLHRSDGPAVIKADGTCQWWLHGKQVPKL